MLGSLCLLVAFAKFLTAKDSAAKASAAASWCNLNAQPGATLKAVRYFLGVLKTAVVQSPEDAACVDQLRQAAAAKFPMAQEFK